MSPKKDSVIVFRVDSDTRLLLESLPPHSANLAARHLVEAGLAGLVAGDGTTLKPHTQLAALERELFALAQRLAQVRRQLPPTDDNGGGK